MSVALQDFVSFCDQAAGTSGFPDYPGAANGLQVENEGRVSRIGAAVDASLETFQMAAAAGVDALIVHHGLFWDRPRAYTGLWRRKLAFLFAHNIAVYSCHLPLDAHPRIGNNALLARALGLVPDGGCLPFEGREIGVHTEGCARSELVRRLEQVFPGGVRRIERGSEQPARVVVCTGGGNSALPHLASVGADTLVTGELSQHAFAEAADRGLNLYLCGHYATETFGVRALAEQASAALDLPWTFLDTGCPL